MLLVEDLSVYDFAPEASASHDITPLHLAAGAGGKVSERGKKERILRCRLGGVRFA